MATQYYKCPLRWGRVLGLALLINVEVLCQYKVGSYALQSVHLSVTKNQTEQQIGLHTIKFRSGNKSNQQYVTFPFSVAEGRKVELLRYEDPEIGPRKIPNCEKPYDGKVVINTASTFNINLELQKVTLQENGRPIDIGSQVIYRIIQGEIHQHDKDFFPLNCD